MERFDEKQRILIRKMTKAHLICELFVILGKDVRRAFEQKRITAYNREISC
jgi:hypothetical protein